jgi:hypothetical protein
MMAPGSRPLKVKFILPALMEATNPHKALGQTLLLRCRLEENRTIV